MALFKLYLLLKRVYHSVFYQRHMVSTITVQALLDLMIHEQTISVRRAYTSGVGSILHSNRYNTPDVGGIILTFLGPQCMITPSGIISTPFAPRM